MRQYIPHTRLISIHQAFAWESREFLRKKVVGKKIQYAIDHSATNRDYVTVYLAPVGGQEPECVNHTVVSEGWANVHNKDAKRAYPTCLGWMEWLIALILSLFRIIWSKETP